MFINSKSMDKFLYFFFILLASLSLKGQVSNVLIERIEIKGAKKTKHSLILNELSFKSGDSIPLADLMPSLKRNEKYLLNTFLFNEVKIKINQWAGNKVCIEIVLKESWYIFPIPQFELADRNFNVWWVRHNRNINRVNLGLWFIWRNLTGYNDLLKTIIQFGYTRKFEFEYNLPAMGRKRKFGFGLNVLYSDNKEKDYNLESNKLAFYSDFSSKEAQFSRFRTRLRLYYRPALTQLHRFSLSYLQLGISDTLSTLNRIYFSDGAKSQQSFSLEYRFLQNKVDINAYPLSGYLIDALVHKKGLGIFNNINTLYTKFKIGYYFNWFKNFFIQSEILGKLQIIRGPLPYYDNKSLGFKEEYIRGFQYYVINGQDYLILKSDINYKIFDFKIPLFKKIKMSYLEKIPVKIHTRIHFDLGYVWDNYTSTNLNNRLLSSAGIGLDLILYAYNIILQFEYTFNNIGENGLFFKYKFNF